MTKVNGNLLVTSEGFEVSQIPMKEREKAVLGFYDMKLEAERNHDRFYALSEVFEHEFSYGPFYPNFYNMTWDVFKSCPSLNGIGQLAFEMMQAFCQNPTVESLEDENVFRGKEEPRAHTGYCNTPKYDDFVGDLPAWEEWHRHWYTSHPQDIEWDKAENDWLPRQDVILKILRRELLAKYKEAYSEEEAEHIVSKIANNVVANEFHEHVMRHMGMNLAAYSATIGAEICRSNYYIEEVELSSLEQHAAGSLRKIFSIIGRSGKRQFISIDHRHGMFEFHNELGVHLGEFRFDGSFNTAANSSHSLQCIREWRRQVGKR